MTNCCPDCGVELIEDGWLEAEDTDYWWWVCPHEAQWFMAAFPADADEDAEALLEFFARA